MEAAENARAAEGTVAYLGLGSSLGDRLSHLREAIRRLRTLGPGVQVEAVSPVYESPHMGLEPGDATKFPPHLNCVVRIRTTLTPVELLERVQQVEEAGKRQRSQRWGPRTIDIDILLYGNRTLRTDRLTLPHPGIAERAFVLYPLADLAPDLTLPGGRTVASLLRSKPILSQPIERVANDELLL
ncbi:MAG TPA: 2-amino-4-hydroxy-6-hydroxymethyldihydropteridine diphosphokinase [Chthonomonadaceae bacterium]|nr:2-amino-4-hydroxy-6-hydroxymethyldihydropteridine diphosphokinase [Chthonomonadaceae bacterium]